MLVLGLDTALSSCSVALLRDGEPLAARALPLEKGHAEHIAPMAGAVLTEAGVRAADLDRVGVVVGPGGFAGVRVGVAFARGLAIGTKLKAVGVTSLEALAHGAFGAALSASLVRSATLPPPLARSARGGRGGDAPRVAPAASGVDLAAASDPHDPDSRRGSPPAPPRAAPKGGRTNGGEPAIAAVIDAHRGEVYAALYSAGETLISPFAASPAEARLRLLAAGATAAVGDGVRLIDPQAEHFADLGAPAIDACVVARLAAVAREPLAAPIPLYLRNPDAKPAAPSAFAALLLKEGEH